MNQRIVEPKLQYITIGDIRVSKSGKTIIVEIGGKRGIAWMYDLRALLRGSLLKIPIKSKETVYNNSDT